MKVKKLVESQKNMRQCRQVVKRIARARSYTLSQLKEVEREISQPDEAQCIDIMDKAALEKANELATFLCITSFDDINRLAAAMRIGFTELLSVQFSGNHMLLVNPDQKGYWVELDEPMECIPTEYIEFNEEDDDEIKDLKVRMANGEYEEIVRDFDLDVVCSPEEDRDAIEEVSCHALSGLQRTFTETSDLDERRSAVCNSFTSLASAAIDAPQTWMVPPSSGELRKSVLASIYFDALMQSVDLSKRGDTEEAIIRCLLPDVAGHLFDSEPSEEVFEEGELEYEEEIVEDEVFEDGEVEYEVEE